MLMRGKLLIVEDEEKLAGLLSDYLQQAGFVSFCLGKEIRSFSTVPIIMVTARIEEIDRLLGLELGADDYICKPFSPREVVARVKAVLRRTGGGHTIHASGLVLNEACYLASLNGHDLGLTAVEFKLLQILVANPGRIFSRQQLMDRIYPDQRSVSDRTIDSHIKKLRKKFSANSSGMELIYSLYGVGYKFEAQ